MITMELSALEIIDLCPMRIELVSERKICKLSDLSLGNVFFENVKFSGTGGYFISYSDDLLVLASLGYSGKFKLGFPNHFTRRNNIEVYIPHIFKQLSGKNKSNYVYFPFYEGWKEYYNSIEDYRNSSDKRMFLHSYLNQNITID